MTPPMLSWVGLVLLVLLVTSGISDVRLGKIHNALTYPALAVAFIGHAMVGGLSGDGDKWMGLTGALVGFAVGFGPLLLAWLAGGIGGGDAKIAGAIGALAGWEFALDTLFFGLAAAAVMAMGIMLRRKIFRQTMKRILRFIFLALTPTRPADPATPDSPKLPFGLALCVGAAVAVVIAVSQRSVSGFLFGM